MSRQLTLVYHDLFDYSAAYDASGNFICDFADTSSDSAEKLAEHLGYVVEHLSTSEYTDENGKWPAHISGLGRLVE